MRLEGYVIAFSGAARVIVKPSLIFCVSSKTINFCSVSLPFQISPFVRGGREAPWLAKPPQGVLVSIASGVFCFPCVVQKHEH